MENIAFWLTGHQDSVNKPEEIQIESVIQIDIGRGILDDAVVVVNHCQPSEISFDIPAVIDGEPNPLYDDVTGYKQIYTKVVLVECSVLTNQRRGDVPDAPPDSHLQNPAKHGIGWGARIPEVECAFFQKQLLALQGLRRRPSLC